MCAIQKVIQRGKRTEESCLSAEVTLAALYTLYPLNIKNLNEMYNVNPDF